MNDTSSESSTTVSGPKVPLRVTVILVLVILVLVAAIAMVTGRSRSAVPAPPEAPGPTAAPVATPTAAPAASNAVRAQAPAGLKGIKDAIDLYRFDTGNYPSSLRFLVETDGTPTWQGPYIGGREAKDAWGNPYLYQALDDGYRVASAGPDGKMGTGDDLTD